LPFDIVSPSGLVRNTQQDDAINHLLEFFRHLAFALGNFTRRRDGRHQPPFVAEEL
jgi:hypothetical protein